MRKFVVSLLTITSLLTVFGTIQAQAGCQSIDIQNQLGAVNGEVCFDSTTGELTVDGTVFVVATGKTYTITADATVTRTSGHYVATGTVEISDGTATKTITFSTGGMSSVMAATSFATRTFNYALMQRPPAPYAPYRMPMMNPAAE